MPKTARIKQLRHNVAWPDRVDFRPGELAGPMEARMAELGGEEPLTPSSYLRRLIAADCGVQEPEMRGNVAYLRQYAKKKKARRKRKG